MKILILESDLNLGNELCRSFRLNGFDVLWLRNIKSALKIIDAIAIDFILMSDSLSDGDSLCQVKKWRQNGIELPVIIISSSEKREQLILSLNAGADGHLYRSFSFHELMSRINAIHRRVAGYKNQLWGYGGVNVNPVNCTATISGETLRLSKKELGILSKLIFYAGRAVPRARLEELALDENESNTLEVYIHKLRKKIGRDTICTIRGVGYAINR